MEKEFIGIMEHLGSSSDKSTEARILTNAEIIARKDQLLQFLRNSTKYWAEYHTEDTIIQSLLLGSRQLWVLDDERKNCYVQMITEIDILDTGDKELRVNWIAGEGIHEAMMHFPVLEAFCKKVECRRIVAYCRPGFIKILKALGFIQGPTLVYRNVPDVKGKVNGFHVHEVNN